MENNKNVTPPSEDGHKQKPGEHKKYVFFIGKEKYETDESSLTVREILEDYAKVNTSEKTLALKEEGGSFHEYKNLDESITMKNGMHFVLFDSKPTPVS